MKNVEIVNISHLGGSEIGCCFGADFDASRPTLVMVNSFATSCQLYRPQFNDKKLMEAANLVSFELYGYGYGYGHGQTRTGCEQFTYWDSAIANLQAMEKLNISSAFILGTSQGGGDVVGIINPYLPYSYDY